MIEVYAVNIQDMPESLINDFEMKNISYERRNRIKRLRFPKDKKACLLAERLIYYCMKRKGREIECSIVIDDTGKPRFLNSNLHFNISHSSDWVICAFSDYDVGIDIEKIEEIDLNIAKRYYNIHEYKKIINFDNVSQKNNLFCLLWTLKESYLKNTGSGIRALSPQIRFETEKNIKGYVDEAMIEKKFFSQKFAQDYYISICYDEKEVLLRKSFIQIIDINQMF